MKTRTKSHVEALDKRELMLAIALLDPSFTGTKEDASLYAGYARAKTVYDKLRDDRFCAGMEALQRELIRHTISTNAAKRQRLMDHLYRRAIDPRTEASDAKALAETWGKFNGDIGTGGVSVSNSVTANACGENGFANRLRSLEERKGIVAEDEG